MVSLSAAQPDIASAISVIPASPRLSWPVLRWGAVVAFFIGVCAVFTPPPKQESRQIAATMASGKPAAETKLPVPNSVIEKTAASFPVPASEAKAVLAAKPSASRQQAITASPANGDQSAAASSPVEMADARTISPFAEVVPGRAKDALAESQDV